MPHLTVDLSVVVPFYNEEGNIRALYREMKKTLDAVRRDYEFVLVDDGSQDQTGAILDEIARADRRTRVVHLAPNQGEAAALSAGFREARGRIIVTLDGDGQNDPQDIPALLAKLEQGYAVVTGRRRERRENYWARVLPSRLANGLIARVTGVPVHDCGCGLKVYRSEVISGVYLPHGMHRFLPAILPVAAGAVAEIDVADRARQSGQSHYGLRRVFSVIRDLLPVRWIRRGQSRAERSVIRALSLATLAFVLISGSMLSTRTPVKLAASFIAGIGAFYFVIALKRVREFTRSQLRSRQEQE
ncbi:MAG: glycosyltransferase family 2 protein [Deltaproteobacteria bacterium]|nr:glycosyltransferase family 2 protein [Deltaproteobacteria bacterium]